MVRLVALTVSGLLAGLGLAAPSWAGAPWPTHAPPSWRLIYTGAQEVSRRGDPDGRGRAVLKVYRTRVCSTIEVRGIEPATAAHIHLGFRREVGPIVATLKKPMAASSTTRTPVHRTASSTTPVYQTTAPVTTTVPQTTAFQATTRTTTTTVPQTSTVRTYQSTRLPGIKRLELTGGCVEVPRALTEELRDHPRRFYVNVHNNPYPEGP
jgi:hypothetical protein